MKPTVAFEEITPSKAAEYLTNVDPEHQRKFSLMRGERYAREMRAGHWGLSPQGISFDVEGRLIDGQHRLWAVVETCTTISCPVNRGLPVIGANGVHTIDIIDRGAPRTVGQQLQLRHGFTNGTLHAAILNGMLACYTGTKFKIEAPTGSDLYALFKTDIDRVVEMTSSTRGMMLGAVIGTAVFCRAVFKTELDEFYEPMMNGENLKNGMPALVMRNYLLNNVTTRGGGANTMVRNRDALCTCAMRHVLHESMTVLKSSSIGYQFFLKKQPANIRKVREIMGLKEEK